MTQVLERPVDTGAPTVAEHTARRRAVLEWIAVHSLGVAAALFFTLPFVFVVLTSLMSDQQALTRDLIPRTWEWGNYAQVFDTPGFLTWWRNTLIYAGLGTVLTVVSSVPVAYALAKFRFRGRNLTLMLVISMMMLPPQVVIIPMYLFWAKKNTRITGAMTSTVAAIVRFQSVWCAPLNDSSPYDRVHAPGFSDA